MEGMDTLTDMQTRVLAFLKEFQAKHQYPPTGREISEHFGLKSQTSAMKYLKALTKKGLIKRETASARAITIL